MSFKEFKSYFESDKEISTAILMPGRRERNPYHTTKVTRIAI
jgi:hypothetical protein